MSQSARRLQNPDLFSEAQPPPPKNKQSCLRLHQPLVRFANIFQEAPTSSQKPSEFGIASQIVKAVLQKALHSGCKHSLVTALQVEPLHSQARQWLEGALLSELPDLMIYIGKLRCAWSAERSVEGMHRRVQQYGASSPHHSEV